MGGRGDSLVANPAGIGLGISFGNELCRNEDYHQRRRRQRSRAGLDRNANSLEPLDSRTAERRTLAREFIPLRGKGSQPGLPRMATDQDPAAGLPLTDGLRLAFV